MPVLLPCRCPANTDRIMGPSPPAGSVAGFGFGWRLSTLSLACRLRNGLKT